MKIKVKGLVFVGFAAAVFAQSALAAAPSEATASELKTVSSKAYVDSKFNGTAGQVITQGTNRGDTTYTNVGNTGSYINVDSTGDYPGDGVLVTGKAVKEAMDASLGALEADEIYITINSATDGNGVTTKTVQPKQTPASLATDLTGTLTNGVPGALSGTAGQKIVTAAAVKALVDAESVADSTTISGSSSNGVVPTSKNVYDFVNGNYQAKAATGDTMYVGHNGTWRALETATTDSQAATDYVTLKWDSTNSVYQVNLDSGHIAATSALTGTTPTNDSGLVTAGSIRSTILQAVESSIGLNSTDDSTVPSTKNVYDFVAGYAQDNYQPKILDSDAGQVMIGYNTQTGEGANATYASAWKVLDDEYNSGAGYVHFDTTENSHVMRVKLENVGHAGTDITNATAAQVQSGTDKLASAYAVQEYVQSLLNGNNIPAPTGECSSIASDADGGCALVLAYYAAEGTLGQEGYVPAGVRLKWTKMAQQ